MPLAVDPSAVRDPGGLVRGRGVRGGWRGAVRREEWSCGAARAAATRKHVSFARHDTGRPEYLLLHAVIFVSSYTTLYELYGTLFALVFLC